MAKDVLKVWRMARQHIELCAESPDVLSCMDDAHDLIAELIAADVEYDETVEEINRPGEISAEAWRRAHRAEERRAAALAACRGLA